MGLFASNKSPHATPKPTVPRIILTMSDNKPIVPRAHFSPTSATCCRKTCPTQAGKGDRDESHDEHQNQAILAARPDPLRAGCSCTRKADQGIRYHEVMPGPYVSAGGETRGTAGVLRRAWAEDTTTDEAPHGWRAARISSGYHGFNMVQ